MQPSNTSPPLPPSSDEETPPLNWRDHVNVHPACDAMPEMSEAELKELGEDIKAHGLREGLAYWIEPDGSRFLLDARQRLTAMAGAGILGILANGKFCDELGEPLRYRNYEKSDGDPYEIVASLNIQRRHLDAEGKRKAIDALLKLDPGKSDRQIAAQTKSSPTTVGARRKKAEAAGDLSILDKRTDRKGHERPAKRKATAKKRTPRVVPAEQPVEHTPAPTVKGDGVQGGDKAGHSRLNIELEAARKASPKGMDLIAAESEIADLKAQLAEAKGARPAGMQLVTASASSEIVDLKAKLAEAQAARPPAFDVASIVKWFRAKLSTGSLKAVAEELTRLTEPPSPQPAIIPELPSPAIATESTSPAIQSECDPDKDAGQGSGEHRLSDEKSPAFTGITCSSRSGAARASDIGLQSYRRTIFLAEARERAERQPDWQGLA